MICYPKLSLLTNPVYTWLNMFSSRFHSQY